MSERQPGAPALQLRERRWAREREFARRFRHRPAGVVSLAIVLVVLVAALVPGLLSTHDPIALSDQRLSPPTGEHWFGADTIGRDTYSRLVHGARTALLVGLISVGIGVAVGLPYGLLAGYLGGRKDEAMMRVMDALYAYPALLLALIMVAVLGSSMVNVMIAIGIVFVPLYARLVRGSTLSAKENDYVMAAEAMGAATPRILFRHIAPNVLAPVLVQMSLGIGFAIIIEAALSYLGLGTQPPDPSWGTMLRSAQVYMATNGWGAFFPGMAIVLTVLSFNLLGDVLRDLLDPRLRGAD
ncbi:MAG: ABC transporter permease [Chloroflexi bacterium]|nr:ABC transporter permease [Chloroflexota bacterium]